MTKPVLTADELNIYIAEVYPQIMEQYPGYNVDLVEPNHVIVRMETDENHLRAGNTISGPTLFALADMGGYACVLSHIGRQALAVTTNLNINFMRKAEAGVLVADNRILKLGKRLMVFDTTITANGNDDIIAHATGTYAIPPR
ncbi:MAG: PaaI family thioesterase [Pseudomonadota bacterium]